ALTGSRAAAALAGSRAPQLTRQREVHLLLAADDLLRHFRAPRSQPLDDLPHEHFRRRRSGRDTDDTRLVEPLTMHIVGAVHEVPLRLVAIGCASSPLGPRRRGTSWR